MPAGFARDHAGHQGLAGTNVIGRKVRKQFEGDFYDGEVRDVQGDGDDLLYSVLYTDGDQEQVDGAELASILMPLESATVPSPSPSPRSAKKRPRHDEPPAAASPSAAGSAATATTALSALSADQPLGLGAVLSPADERAAAQTRVFATFLETLVSAAKGRHQPGGGALLQAALGGAEVEDFDEDEEDDDEEGGGGGGGKMEEDEDEDAQRSESSTSPVLSSAELAKLQQRVSSCAHWSLVPTEPLTDILAYLDAHVSEGLNVSGLGG